jgi:ribosomal protein L29
MDLEAREELRKLRFGVGGVKDPREKDAHKTLVARIMTELRARKA